MDNNQIVKKKRTLHRSPTPAEYGIVLERAPVQKSAAGSAGGTAASKKPQGSLSGSQAADTAKKTIHQSSLDEIMPGSQGTGAANSRSNGGTNSGTKVGSNGGTNSGTGSGKNQTRTPPPRKGGKGKTILTACIILVALGVAYGISTGSKTSSSSSSTSTLPPIQAPDITLKPTTDTGSSGESDQGSNSDQSVSSILDQLGGSDGSGDTSAGNSDTTSGSDGTGVVSPDTAYTEIVQTYASLLAQDSQTFTEAYDRGDYEQDLLSTDGDGINYELVYAYFNYPDYTEAHYGLRDYNGDGTPELVIILSSDGGSWGQVWAGYTFDGTKAVPLFTGLTRLGYRIDLYTLPENAFMIHGGGGALAGTDTICRIADGGTGLLVLEKYEYDESANGNRDHYSSSGVMTDEEFQTKYYNVMVNAAEGVTLYDVKSDASVQTQ